MTNQDELIKKAESAKAFYKQVKGHGGIDIHVIYNFGSHRVDADLSFGENCDGLRDDYIENIVKEAAEHAVKALNEHPSLSQRVKDFEAALIRIAKCGSRDGLSDVARAALEKKQ